VDRDETCLTFSCHTELIFFGGVLKKVGDQYGETFAIDDGVERAVEYVS
jgi:hypothetical protein